jgi:hypothetical protein
MEAHDCVVHTEELAVSPWNLKAGEEIDLYVVTAGNCEMSNPTKADKTIIMVDVWANFVKPEHYRIEEEKYDYLETGELPICVP